MNDRRTINLVIGLVGLVAVISVAGLIYLIAVHTPTADLLPVTGLATGSVGALGGMLANTKSVDLEALAKLAPAPDAAPDPVVPPTP